MIDENLPTFFFKASADGIKHDATIHVSQYGADAWPVYKVRHPDPISPTSKNRYAAAICDSYNSDILFGEVLLIPEWTQPNPSAEELRLNGGVPPPPQPILPTEFTVQLYNPDQQITVKQHAGTWNSSAYWGFEMPQQTFRQPSVSALDRTQSDPTASETTPKIDFRWKKDSKLSKDLVCCLSGKSQNPDGSKRRNKEPDITVAFFRHLRELTINEPNLSRVDMEDPKGLEVVLLLSAAVIKDVYYGPMREVFNISEASRRGPAPLPTGQNSAPMGVLASQNLPRKQVQQSGHSPNPSQQNNRPPLRVHTSNPRPPPTDPRSQWEIDAETSRLRLQVEKEEKARKHAEHAETKRLKRMVEEEEKIARRKQAEINKETERLRRAYEAEQRRFGIPNPQLPPRQSAPMIQQPQYHWQGNQTQYAPQPQPQRQQQYFQAAQRPSSQYLQPYQPTQAPLKSKRSSFFGLRSLSDEPGKEQRLLKKKSAMF